MKFIVFAALFLVAAQGASIWNTDDCVEDRFADWHDCGYGGEKDAAGACVGPGTDTEYVDSTDVGGAYWGEVAAPSTTGGGTDTGTTSWGGKNVDHCVRQQISNPGSCDNVIAGFKLYLGRTGSINKTAWGFIQRGLGTGCTAESPIYSDNSVTVNNAVTAMKTYAFEFDPAVAITRGCDYAIGVCFLDDTSVRVGVSASSTGTNGVNLEYDSTPSNTRSNVQRWGEDGSKYGSGSVWDEKN